MELEHRIRDYVENSVYPFHMPGHKRNPDYQLFGTDISNYDMTEIPGFDNLSHPTGILKDCQDRISAYYGCKDSLILVNGCTAGILASIALIAKQCKSGAKILIARNCHKSVYNALMLNRLEPVYIWPEVDENGICSVIDPLEVEAYLEQNPDIKAFVITSPTYEGVVSDMKAIVDICHERGILVIADEAHGAHFGKKGFPSDSVRLGCDIVIHGLHKTLPALTQCAIVHFGGELVDRELFESLVHMYQTTSPSYILMASAIKALDVYMSDDLWDEYVKRLSHIRYELDSELKHLKLFIPDTAFDPSKLVILTNGYMRGDELAGKLRKFGIEVEMASIGYVICMTSVLDSDIGFDRLLKALADIDSECDYRQEDRVIAGFPRLSMGMIPFDAFEKRKRNVLLRDAVGLISANSICIYPPGIPMIACGEYFTKDVSDALYGFSDGAFEIMGIDENMCVEVL